jgi:hypothetical protein
MARPATMISFDDQSIDVCHFCKSLIFPTLDRIDRYASFLKKSGVFQVQAEKAN